MRPKHLQRHSMDPGDIRPGPHHPRRRRIPDRMKSAIALIVVLASLAAILKSVPGIIP